MALSLLIALTIYNLFITLPPHNQNCYNKKGEFMKKKINQDSLLQGNITRSIISLSLPLMLNNLIRTLYNLTDGLYVARLSAEDFAATAFVWPINFLFISIGMGLGVASTAQIAQSIGGRQLEKANQTGQNMLNISLLVGLTLSTIGYLASPSLIKWMGGQGSFGQKSSQYLMINFIGLLFDFLYFSYQAILNADGKTKIITLISTISSIVNVVLDPFFIFEKVGPFSALGMGITGAAWATVISKMILYLFSIWAVRNYTPLRPKLYIFTKDWVGYRKLMTIALPASFGYGGAALGFTVLNGLIQSYGTETLAAYSMGNRISDLMTQPQMGIGMALTSLVGQNLGAKQYDRARAIVNKTIYLVLALSVFSSVLIFAFRQPLIQLFIPDISNTDLLVYAHEYLNYTAFIIFFMGLFSVYNGTFQGMGKTTYSMVMSIGRLWIFRLPFIWLFTHFTNLGSTGIWISMLLSNAITVGLAAIFYRLIKWDHLTN